MGVSLSDAEGVRVHRRAICPTEPHGRWWLQQKQDPTGIPAFPRKAAKELSCPERLLPKAKRKLRIAERCQSACVLTAARQAADAGDLLQEL